MSDALHVSPSWLMGYDVPMDSVIPEIETIDTSKLTETNLKRLEAYYQALLDSQDGK